MVAGCMLLTIFSTLPELKKNVVGVGLFFGTLLSVGIIIGTAAAWVVVRMDWSALYYFLIILQVISIII
jgi:DHA2 family multidrug resistance protein